MAPGTKIEVYFAPNTEQGWIDVFQEAIHGNGSPPGVISLSWGAPEAGWTNSLIQTLETDISAAALLGITLCVASGDFGSRDEGPTHWDGKHHADFPASAPHALGVGGTTITVAGANITAEATWNNGITACNGGSGGGISDVFGVPTYQSSAGVPPSANPNHRIGRGVPDVSADADPGTGYESGCTANRSSSVARAPLRRSGQR